MPIDLSIHRGVRIDYDGLRAALQGDVVRPGEENWDAARRAWNLAVDQRPAAVVLPESAEDVAEVVRFARAHGLRLAPQGTGHNAGPLGPLQDTILVKTERMRGVEIDASSRRARVEAGVLWAEVSEAAAPHGLAALAGSSPDVGVVGYTLGGGMSWLARAYGLAANSVEAVELVTADGRLVRANADHEPALFWALRGGGGSFGIVTALEFRLYPIAEVYAGALFFPIERASEVLHAWREWVQDVPDEVTSVGRVLRFPPIPDIPEPLRGRDFALVEATYVGDEESGAELIAPLRALGPELDTFATIPAARLNKLHMDPEQPVPGIGDGMLLESLSADALDEWLTAVGPNSQSPLLSVELRHMGGALRRAPRGAGALGAFDAAFALFAVGVPTDPEVAAAVERAVHRLQVAMAPWAAEKRYLNFTERPVHAGDLFADDAYRRLQLVKAAYDPDDVFRANHPIPPADGAAMAVAA
jgi:FAD/FMN-containing dehydrogenase